MYYEVIVGRKAGEGIFTYKASPELFTSDARGRMLELGDAGDRTLAPGTMVEVPLMKTRAPGVVVKKVAQPEFKCRNITRMIYTRPLPSHLTEIAFWMAEYYATPVSGVMGMILPNGLLKKRRDTGVGTTGTYIVTDTDTKTTGVEQKTEQTEQININSLSIERLLQDTPKNIKNTPLYTQKPEIPLNPAQKNALKALQQPVGATKLLLGVTGSGKTNIYLKMADKAISGQKSVVLLVPEIALTGQLVQIFKNTFGEMVRVIHSQQTEVERQRIFEKLLLSDAPQIVIGPRSALFAPLSNLGLIIIDEEHESTYYQENTPKYSAIRVASQMAEILKIPCILGSATPAVEDFYLAKKRGSLVILSEKAKKTAVKPEIKIVDFKNRDEFSRNRYFSTPLLKSIERNLKEGRQSLIFHNRRGSSPLTICEDCGEELMCPNCFLPLTLHVDTYEMQCHTCGHKCRVPAACPKCGGGDLIHKGFGTKLLETELMRLFPQARVKRFDADNKKGETLDAVFSSVKEGGVDILVGTQMLAKGLDLPLLATVGVVQADAGLSLPDYAAEERVFQLLTQVIGRVGRGHSTRAEVYVQTYQPEHPVLEYAAKEDYLGFSEYLLKKRRKSGFPPYKFVAKVSVTMKTEAAALRKIQQQVANFRHVPKILISPPTPAFHERTSRGYTWEMTVRAGSRRQLLEAFSGLDANFHVSLDPPSLL